MRFADQNKTKFATSRGELENRLKLAYQKTLISKLKSSNISKAIDKRVEEKLFDENKLETRQLETLNIDNEHYFTQNPSDNALYWDRGIATIILGTKYEDGKTHHINEIGNILLEIIIGNNY